MHSTYTVLNFWIQKFWLQNQGSPKDSGQGAVNLNLLTLTLNVSVTQMLKCIELDERLKAMDQEITVNPQFVQKVIDSDSPP